MESDTVTFENSAHTYNWNVPHTIQYADVAGHEFRPMYFTHITWRDFFVKVVREFVCDCQEIARDLHFGVKSDDVRRFPLRSATVSEISITYRDGRRLVIATEAPNQPTHSRLGE